MTKAILQSLKVEELKTIIRSYNLHTKIKMTKRTKADLVDDLDKHVYFDNGDIKLKSGNITSINKVDNTIKDKQDKKDKEEKDKKDKEEKDKKDKEEKKKEEEEKKDLIKHNLKMWKRMTPKQRSNVIFKEWINKITPEEKQKIIKENKKGLSPEMVLEYFKKNNIKLDEIKSNRMKNYEWHKNFDKKQEEKQKKFEILQEEQKKKEAELIPVYDIQDRTKRIVRNDVDSKKKEAILLINTLNHYLSKHNKVYNPNFMDEIKKWLDILDYIKYNYEEMSINDKLKDELGEVVNKYLEILLKDKKKEEEIQKKSMN